MFSCYNLAAMKTWLVVGVLLAGILQAVPKQADKSQSNQNDGKHLAEQSPKPATAGTENDTTTGVSPGKEESSANRESKQLNWCERLLRPVVDNWPILAVTVWAIIVALGTLNHMRESSERQLRAYVISESGTIFNVANPVPIFQGQVFIPTGAEISNPACGPGVRIQIKNAGQTPAYEVTHFANICFREQPLKSSLPARDPNMIPASSILGPGIPSTKLLFMPQPLTAQETADLRAGNGAVYVYGEIVYRDTFGKRWHTSYRLMHHPYGGAIGVSTDLSFCDEGNDAT